MNALIIYFFNHSNAVLMRQLEMFSIDKSEKMEKCLKDMIGYANGIFSFRVFHTFTISLSFHLLITYFLN